MKTVNSIRAEYLDCCLSDYFQRNRSSADEVLAVPMFHGITYREAYNAAKDEFHNSSGFFDDIEDCGTMVESALHALFSGLENPDLPADFAQYIEDSEDDDPDVYLYIGLYAEKD